MFSQLFSKLFGKKQRTKEQEEQQDQEEQLEDQWYEEKSQLMEQIMGKEHDMVLHSLIPYDLGGALDLYYYPNGIEGTGIATKELSHATRESSTNDKYKKYELVMFTRERLNLDDAQNEDTAFGQAHQNISSLLNPIANYSEQAVLNPNETCEFPGDMERIGGKCLIFSAYQPAKQGIEDFGLLLVIEIHRSEVDYAREHGGQALLQLLRENGHYPYSDLARKPVV